MNLFSALMVRIPIRNLSGNPLAMSAGPLAMLTEAEQQTQMVLLEA